MAQPFTDFRIVPSYSRGFTYLWEVAGDFNDPGPWVFEVEEAKTSKGPWIVISPELVNRQGWKEDARPPVNKANVLYFRVVMKTSRGIYESPAVQPYGVLPRRDFLVAREIMRQATLHSSGMAGVECKAYILSTFGPKCTKCLDPVTGMIRDSHCKYCFGTGRNPAYNGPYDMWMDFSEDAQHQVSVDENGTTEKKGFQVRAVGSPTLKYGDVVVVPGSDKRYYVRMAAQTTEIRRVPVIQTLTVDEAPQTDKIYDL
jgi:hypothetical protein